MLTISNNSKTGLKILKIPPTKNILPTQFVSLESRKLNNTLVLKLPVGCQSKSQLDLLCEKFLLITLTTNV
jgi:hypothetical protein